jgi:uncharacterized protein
MKPWSLYNNLFHSERYGSFLYNALSGVMLELDDEHFLTAGKLRDGYQGELPDEQREFLALLEEKGFLAHREEELLQLMQQRYLRNAECFSTSYLRLTICPTLACNFGCPYCFEHSQNDTTVMSDETIDALISFIKKHQDAKSLSVNWYGGEPTLAFDVIESLTRKFLDLYPEYDNASLVTNAYQLNQEKIDRLNELKITTVQITLDGGEATHNSRRMLKRGGGSTFSNILNNIDLLMHSSWKGNCSIRMNVDRTNQHEYAILCAELLYRYKGKKLLVYPGRVQAIHDNAYYHKCGLCNSEWSQFTIDGYNKAGLVPPEGLYPRIGKQNVCSATSYFSYIIGPKGEISKCWEDVGKEHMVIGSVHDDDPVCNSELVARYSIGTDPFDDDICVECVVMPICGGGCVNKRMRSKQFGEGGIDYCSPFKESLISYLEAYLYTLQTKESCAAVLGKNFESDMNKGFRMVQPANKSKA